ncbi:10651_t:CDS:2 [Funneliformis mosseae]|uniref:10651_t:CDS:1 n=1 Tax=Funneliformis mosseae TaxID=27381 RepID=A0A9N9ASA0_FUNMO|nr:10651_t:CDS:2 [Funneliformis mosseae]
MPSYLESGMDKSDIVPDQAKEAKDGWTSFFYQASKYKLCCVNEHSLYQSDVG